MTEVHQSLWNTVNEQAKVTQCICISKGSRLYQPLVTVNWSQEPSLETAEHPCRICICIWLHWCHFKITACPIKFSRHFPISISTFTSTSLQSSSSLKLYLWWRLLLLGGIRWMLVPKSSGNKLRSQWVQHIGFL